MDYLFIDHLNELRLTKKKIIKDNLNDSKYLTKNYFYLKRLNERLNSYTFKKLNQIHNLFRNYSFIKEYYNRSLIIDLSFAFWSQYFTNLDS